jgi:hypothetical protein
MAEIIFLQHHPRFLSSNASTLNETVRCGASVSGNSKTKWTGERFGKGESNAVDFYDWDDTAAAYEAAQVDTQEMESLEDLAEEIASDVEDWARSEEEGWFYDD